MRRTRPAWLRALLLMLWLLMQWLLRSAFCNARPASGFVLEDHAFEQIAHDQALFFGHAGDGVELQAQGIARAAFPRARSSG